MNLKEAKQQRWEALPRSEEDDEAIAPKKPRKPRKPDVRTSTPPRQIIEPLTYWAIVKGRRSPKNLAMEEYFVWGNSIHEIAIKYGIPKSRLCNDIFRVTQYIKRCEQTLLVQGHSRKIYKKNPRWKPSWPSTHTTEPK